MADPSGYGKEGGETAKERGKQWVELQGVAMCIPGLIWCRLVAFSVLAAHSSAVFSA
jgi:hypothetical protein